MKHWIPTAAAAGHLQFIKHLIENKNAQFDSITAIQYAAKGGFLNIVKYLSQRAAIKDTQAIVQASGQGHFNIVKYLVEAQGIPIYSSALEQFCFDFFLFLF